MKSWRQKYFEDFEAERVDADNRKGYKIVYTYIGKWFGWSETGEALKRRKTAYAAIVAGFTALFIFCGTRRTSINSSALVAVPGIVAVAALIYCWIGVLQFILSSSRMHERDCRHIYSMIEIAINVLAACFALCLAFSVFLLFRHGFDAQAPWAVLGYALCLLLAWTLLRLHKSLSFAELEEEKNLFDETIGE